MQSRRHFGQHLVGCRAVPSQSLKRLLADTDEQAWAEAGPQITRFWQLATGNPWSRGPLSVDDLPGLTARFAGRAELSRLMGCEHR